MRRQELVLLFRSSDPDYSDASIFWALIPPATSGDSMCIVRLQSRDQLIVPPMLTQDSTSSSTELHTSVSANHQTQLLAETEEQLEYSLSIFGNGRNGEYNAWAFTGGQMVKEVSSVQRIVH
jgi:hypothetical protein